MDDGCLDLHILSLYSFCEKWKKKHTKSRVNLMNEENIEKKKKGKSELKKLQYRNTSVLLSSVM